MSFPTLVNATKQIAQFPGWQDAEPETGYMWFDAPIDIAGVVQDGVFLHGGCYRYAPEKHVTFELFARSQSGRRKIPLNRVDWRSLNGGHSNPRRPGSPVSGLRVSATHFHDFELNWIPLESRMRGRDLSQARNIDEELQSFESLREFVRRSFRITNMDVVLPPKWEYKLL